MSGVDERPGVTEAPGGGASRSRRRWRSRFGGGRGPSDGDFPLEYRSYYRASRIPPYFAEAEEAEAMKAAAAAAEEQDAGGGGSGLSSRGSMLGRRMMRGASSALGLDMLGREVSSSAAAAAAAQGGQTTGERGEADAAAGSGIRRGSSLSQFLSVAGSSFTAGAGGGGSLEAGRSADLAPPSLLGAPGAGGYTNYRSRSSSGMGPLSPPNAGDEGEAAAPASAASISAAAAAGGGIVPPPSVLHPLSEPGGSAGLGGAAAAGSAAVPPTWRLKERMKTVGVGMILALNIGTDPPDVRKPDPCAKLQCWIDPTLMSRAKARERIGERLEQQYARWQQRAKLKYRRALDPTVEDVRNLCATMRRQARGERLLLHYNGHGVPRPTADGEIYVFDKNHTHFIPLSTLDLRKWIGRPSIVVLDCGGAGILLPYLVGMMDNMPGGPDDPAMMGAQTPPQPPPTFEPTEGESDADYAARSVRDTIVLCPTAPGELLPLNAEFPADLFTSCLTTPIPVALRWFVHQNPLSCGGLDAEAVDAIPGKVNDRKTPLGELNWIFTAVTDTIAWNVLPSPLFQRLFRQDLIVASMFRNFLLADRILRSLNCTPMSFPTLPSTSDHPLWEAWDLAVETCLNQLIRDGLLGNEKVALRRPGSSDDITENAGNTDATTQPKTQTPQQQQQASKGGAVGTQAQLQTTPPTSGAGDASAPTAQFSSVTAPFFSEQLSAFEIWLEFATTRVVDSFGGIGAGENTTNCCVGGGTEIDPAAVALLESPEQLPVVLQVLLSQAHRVRALVLLRRFLDLGPGAVNLALSVGIFPYVLKLLQSSIDEYKHVLVGIWAKILHFDPSCQVDLVKDGALPHFIRHLHWGLTTGPATSPKEPSDSTGEGTEIEDAAEQRTMAAVILSAICRGYPLGQSECLKKGLHNVLSALLASVDFDESEDGDAGEGTGRSSETGREYVERDQKRAAAEQRVPPLFRLWLCLCLGNLVRENVAAQTEVFEKGIHLRLSARLDDECPDVRAAACYALGCLLGSTPLPSDPPADDMGGADNSILLPGQPVVALAQQPLLHHHQLQTQQQQVGPLFGQQQMLPAVSLSTQIPHQHPVGRPQSGLVPGLAVAGGVPTLVPTQVGAGGTMVLQPMQHPMAGAATRLLPQQQQQTQQMSLLSQQQQQPQQMPPPLQQQTHPSQQQPLRPPGAQLPGQLHQQAQVLQYGPLGVQGIVPAAINGVPATTLPQNHPQPQPAPPAGAAVPPPFQLHAQQHQQQPLHQTPAGMHPVQHQQPLLRSQHHSLQIHQAQQGQLQQQQMPLNQQRPQPHPHHPAQTAAAGPSSATLEERRQRRINFDLAVIHRLASAMARDASPTVRYEATLSFAGAVRKHLAAFADASADAAAKERQGGSAKVADATESGVEGDESKESTADSGTVPSDAMAPSFAEVWSALHSMQRSDPHPILSAATNQIVSAVNEYVLLNGISDKDGGADGDTLTDMESGLKHSRASSMLNSSSLCDGGGTLLSPPLLGGRPTSLGAAHPPIANRQNQTDHVATGQVLTPFGASAASADEASGGTTAASALLSPSVRDSRTRGTCRIAGESGFYSLPKSRFYEWKREKFAARSSGRSSDELCPTLHLDPLSYEGAIWSYRLRRNAEVHAWSDALSEEYAELAYRPTRGGRGRIEGLFDDLQDEAEARETAKLEAEVSSKKSSLHLHQHAILLNDGKKGSYMMQFHPYESALIVCDGANTISIWDVDESKRSVCFRNGNPKGSRMTSVSWMNAMTTSLLLAGSDDGTIRVWDGLLDGFGQMSNDPPRLVSAFSAAPDIRAGKRGSGLVTEWQQFNGRLIAGGNSNLIRCWDLEAERCANTLESNVGACVTSLTTAWDFDMFGSNGIGSGGALGSPSSRGYSGIGPDIVVAGYSDGNLKVFDVRAKRSPVGNTSMVDTNSRNGSVRRSRHKRLMQYAEHESWIVNTAFTTFGGRNEIASGCVAGDIKFWDLRMQESLRTLDVQRSPMTALAMHPGIPLLSTGSHAQFIKILSLDGDTLQVIRYHEEISGQRIGPVSCLCFHPHKPLLAAGATDEIVSLYSPDAK